MGSWTCSSRKATSVPYAQRDPSDLFLGGPDGLFKEGADAAGIVNCYRGRGAALADLNLDGMLDLVEVNYGRPSRSGVTQARATPANQFLDVERGKATPVEWRSPA